MYLLCEVCDRSIIENESECIKNIAALKKEHDKSIYELTPLSIPISLKSIKYSMILLVVVTRNSIYISSIVNSF